MPINADPTTIHTTACKCCGTLARLYGVVDFNKNCEIARGREVLPLCGVPVYYHRCPECGFIFTVAFDYFTPDDFAEFVYNDEYPLVDPDFAEVRPRANAQTLEKLFGSHPSLRILDYGGGNGVTAQFLRDAGFIDVTTYDPFVEAHTNRPTGKYDLILSFEVVEHSPDPVGTFTEMAELLAPDGMILFSTLIQPKEMPSLGLSWWYAAPRNGHVSLHSRNSISQVVEPLGLVFGSFGDGLHVLFRTVPAFARHLFSHAA